MNIHEYQGKELFASYGIEVGPQVLVTTPQQAREAQESLGGTVVLKAQVLVGGRGKAGGVKVAGSAQEAEEKARQILDLSIKGIPVEKLLVVPAAAIKKEYYLGLTMDRFNKQLILMLSAEGGVDIEELAVSSPEKILKFPIHPEAGIDIQGLNQVLGKVFETPELVSQARKTVETLYTLYMEKDCTLTEVNPYALLEDGRLMVLDAKVNFDDNALFKHPDIEAMRNPEEDSEDEVAAREAGLSFVSMDGDIGCIVNGAGLAMATMDIIKLFGGQPANFLDVGGSSNPQKVLNAIRIILNNKKVTAILLNIFGGITRCDDIAQGLLLAMKEQPIPVPLVVRLIGTNDQEGRRILEEEGIQAKTDLNEAVKAVVAAGKGGKA
ncbi:ADP-forming succinate--CoA ligase subunit beta [Spirochaeta lutea]|uniref:Succinate--CoA ligase [ADP-forming] subunit beta n=1 Tax=Spirochaeta lutea TaxID=1480694 RepID=A0A098QTM4_9SPIO|nr:ADP-forming succinate--CoA ligase subunit beta [Spirochaeta lutea]KGE70906.1 succinyl-CoA synthetase subunit beta [Spirochaeta lutea]